MGCSQATALRGWITAGIRSDGVLMPQALGQTTAPAEAMPV
jgi:hypothetical protein